jgi:hypothetical protein
MEHSQSNFGLDQCHDCGVRRKQVANPTTNYGFVLPSPTDLVTDLPADFDVALQGVDTRLKALQPGTTLGDLAFSSATANTNTRLGIGSAAQVLTVAGGVPTWATPASGGGMTLLSTTSLSGVSTSITGISGSYTDLKVVISDYTFNVESRIQITFNSNTTANNYRGGGFKVEYGTPALTTPRYSETSVSDPSGEPFGSTDYDRIYILDVSQYATASSTKLYQAQSKSFYETSDYYTTGWLFGYFGNTGENAITSIQIKSANGTSTWASGTVKIYGVN